MRAQIAPQHSHDLGDGPLGDRVAAACGYHPNGKWCGCEERTIRAWEHGETTPRPRHVQALAAALELPVAVVVKALRDDREARMRRRAVLKGGAAAAGGLVLPDLGLEDDLHAAATALFGSYPTTAPADLLGKARDLLNRMTRALRGPLRSGQRRQLQVDASQVASLAGMAALFVDRPGDAAGGFLLARSLARESGVRAAQGAALVCASHFHNSIVGDADPNAALELLDAAVPLVGSDGFKAKLAAGLQAQEHALLRQEFPALRALERADAAGEDDEGAGFCSRLSLGASYQPQLSVARVLGHLVRTDEALGHLHTMLVAPGPNVRRPAMLHADVALTHAVAERDPEPACDAAVRSFDVCQATGYDIGVQRIHAIRADMPKAWQGQACLAALDARLALR